MARDPYAVLGVARTVSDAELRRAYLKLARRHHPDSHPEAGRDAAERKMQEINAAWALVSDSTRRASFDKSGDAASRPRTGSPGFRADYSDDRRWVNDAEDPFWSEGAGAGAYDPRPMTSVGTSGRANVLTMIPPGLFLGGLAVLVVGLVVSFAPFALLGAFGMFFSFIAYMMLAFVNMARSRTEDNN